MAKDEIEIRSVDSSFGRGVGLLVVVLFLGVLVATAAADLVNPVPLPKLVGTEKAADEKLRTDANLLDGSLARLVERDLQLTSRVRTWASEDYRLLLYQQFGEASGEQVIVGKDGWVFVRNRAIPPPGRTDRILERWATRLVALDRCLTDHGVDTVVLPLPRRAAIEAERLPRGLDTRVDIDRQAARVLRQHGIEAVDVFPAFEAHQGAPLFYRADAHWNEGGEVVAAEEALRQMDLLLPVGERKGTIRQERFETQGTRDDKNFDLLWLLVGIEDPGGSGALRGEDVPLFDVYHDLDFRLSGHKQPKKMRPLALTGTSFSARRHFALYLEHFGGRRVWDASFVGSGAVVPIRELLLRSGTELPERLLAEIPVYTAFQGAQMSKQISRLLGERPPRHQEDLGPVPLRIDPRGQGERVFKASWENVLVSKQGALLSSWDHLVGLRLQGEVLEGRVQFGALDLDASVQPTREEGAFDFFLPLVAPSHASRPIQLRARARGGPARVRIDDVRFVTTVRRAEARALPLLREEATEGTWVAEFRLGPLRSDSSEGDRALWVGPWAGEAPPSGALRVEVGPLSGDGEFRQILAGRMIEGGWLLGSLGDSGRSGETLLRFSGSGDRFVPKISPLVVPVGAPKQE